MSHQRTRKKINWLRIIRQVNSGSWLLLKWSCWWWYISFIFCHFEIVYWWKKNADRFPTLTLTHFDQLFPSQLSRLESMRHQVNANCQGIKNDMISKVVHLYYFTQYYLRVGGSRVGYHHFFVPNNESFIPIPYPRYSDDCRGILK